MPPSPTGEPASPPQQPPPRAARSGGLSRGLDSLIPPAQTGAPLRVPLDKITPNPDQPRRHFSDNDLRELADSIGEHGLLQPILVRRVAVDRYELIAGERRWRAAGRAGLSDIPVVVSDEADPDRLTLALVENLQREDLSPIETALAFQRLADLGMQQADIADRVGKSRAAVTNRLRLLQLPNSVQTLIDGGQLSESHGLVILSASEPHRIALAHRAAEEGLTVAATQRIAKRMDTIPQMPSVDEAAEHRLGVAEPAVRKAKERLEEVLGLRVDVVFNNYGGRATIRFQELEQLEWLTERIKDGMYAASQLDGSGRLTI